jgi:hypothetical protein
MFPRLEKDIVFYGFPFTEGPPSATLSDKFSCN